jgi:hypothetical protein
LAASFAAASAGAAFVASALAGSSTLAAAVGGVAFFASSAAAALKALKFHALITVAAKTNKYPTNFEFLFFIFVSIRQPAHSAAACYDVLFAVIPVS